MSKAASQAKMKALHDRVATIFLAVLETYQKRLDVVEKLAAEVLDMEEVEAAIVAEVMKEGGLPSPAMMSAITKFLKDNEVLFERDQVDDLSATQKALQERLRNRPSLASLSIVPKVANE